MLQSVPSLAALLNATKLPGELKVAVLSQGQAMNIGPQACNLDVHASTPVEALKSLLFCSLSKASTPFS